MFLCFNLYLYVFLFVFVFDAVFLFVFVYDFVFLFVFVCIVQDCPAQHSSHGALSNPTTQSRFGRNGQLEKELDVKNDIRDVGSTADFADFSVFL